MARSLYGSRNQHGAGVPNIQILHLDAHDLKFPDRRFGLVLLYEAIYCLEEPQRFVSEAKRLLADSGILIICSVNNDWSDFHPSRYAHQYYSVPEIYELLKTDFQEVKLYGGFPVAKRGAKSKLTSLIKRSAVKFHLIPGSLKTRAYLKRIFMGKLVPLPHEVYEGMAPYEPPVEIPSDRVSPGYKIIYAVGREAR